MALNPWPFLFAFAAGLALGFGVGRLAVALRRPGRRPEARLLLLALLAFALRVGGLTTQSLWRDEVDALRFGRDLSTEVAAAFREGSAQGWGRLAARLTQPGFNGPLYFLGLFQWVRVAGDSEFALRFPSAWLGTLAVPLGVALFRRFLPAGAARLVGVFLAAAPFLVWYGQEAKMYALLVVLFLAAWGAAERAQRDPAGWVELALWAAMGLYSHILFALFLPPLLALAGRKGLGRVGGLLLVAGALGLALAFPLWRWQVGQVLRWEGGPRLACGETGFPRVAPLDSLAMLGWGFAVGVWGGFPAWGPIPLAALMALGAALGRVGIRWRWLGWALGPWALLAALSLCRPLFVERYLIAAAPAWFALAALGWARLPGRWLRILALAAVLSPMAAGLGVQAMVPLKSDFRAAAWMVARAYRPDELILFHIGYVQYVFDYYFRKPYAGAWAPATNAGPDGTPVDMGWVDARMRALVRGYRAVWLVYSEAAMWDARDLVRQWLDAHGRLVERHGFVLVEVRRYEGLPP